MSPWKEPSIESISALLLHLHEASLLSEKWPAFLEQFTRLLDLPAMTIQDRQHGQGTSQFNVAVGIDSESLSQYERHFSRVDPYWAALLRNPGDRFIHAEALCPRQRLYQTEFYNDFLARQAEPVGVLTSEVTGWPSQHLRAISTYQRLERPVPGDRVIELIKLFHPHIQYCLSVQWEVGKLTTQARNLESAGDALDSALVLLNERGRAIFLSAKAEALFAMGCGLRLTAGRLTADLPLFATLLSQRISRALTAVVRSTPFIIEPLRLPFAGRALTIRVSAIPRSAAHSLSVPGPERAAVLIQIQAPDGERRTLQAVLSERFRLTPKEIEIALLMQQGLSLHECANRNSVSVHTVRTQLKFIFQKTGMRRQSQLLKLLSELALSG